MSVMVTQFRTIDGVVSDPDEGVLLLGRTTRELFARIWPNRDDEFSQRMNAMPKPVVSKGLTDVSAWANSRLLDGDLAAAVLTRYRTRR